MPTQILVRYGWSGMVGRFDIPAPKVEPSDGNLSAALQRGSPVVIESSRGIEDGRSLGVCALGNAAGKVVRLFQPEDELLKSQLQQFSLLAYSRCEEWIIKNQRDLVLLEVEPLLDGKTLFFHFLQDVDSLLQEHLDELARLYENEVANSEFAKRLAIGCGPGCGTDKATGRTCNSSAGCSSCSAGCFSKR